MAKKDDFMFLDPPYDCVFNDYGNIDMMNGFNEDEHRRLAKDFKNLKCKALMIIGKTPLTMELYGDYVFDEYYKNYAVNIKNRFNNDKNIQIFLISIKAGGSGLNLVGADTVIHLDPWWNVAAENQATDRAHRIGQTKNVEVIKFICENSIEQRVIELQNLKKDIIDKFISNDESSISSITREDLSFILD